MENGQISHSHKIESKEEKELQSTDHRMKWRKQEAINY